MAAILTAPAVTTHSLKKNAALLFAIQLANQAPPLLTLPAVTRALGTEELSHMSFVLAVVAYGLLIADYGFNLLATAAIAVHRADRQERSRFFWQTITGKASLATLCALAMLLGMALLPSVARDWQLYAVAFGLVIASVLTPNWYCHGMERLPVLGLMVALVRSLLGSSLQRTDQCAAPRV